MSAAAQQIAASLSEAQPLAVTYQVKEPVTFVTANLKYEMLAGAKALPYVMLGGGVARVKQDATFSVGGTDVTNDLQQYFVVLGTDLSGSVTKPMFTAGIGVAWPVWKQLVLDFQYRYGRIFLDQGININRVGIGLGFRF
jgi:opacity protein-like surface antigen